MKETKETRADQDAMTDLVGMISPYLPEDVLNEFILKLDNILQNTTTNKR